MKLTKIMALGLLFSMAASRVEISVAAPAQQEQKQKTFWQRHRAKFAAGLVVAGVLITGAALAYHGNKTMSAIKKAGIVPGDPLLSKAVAIVGLLGPMGQRKCLSLIKRAVDKDADKTVIAKVFVSQIGDALAYYYGIDSTLLRNDVGTIINIQVVKQVGKEIEEAANEVASTFLGFLK